ncbi:MAG: hypothetical protein B7Z67_13160 [Acidiphilium sp. 21-60-14]|nr:MAG: hypothetical protein B7Z67_13160 [Acidiphilium sp. 21-60-14]OYV89337.1 MAG: hypothetical protein B7Z57_13075 [Acidiphilium sp. 37-60-79]OZB38300.1 MAG: hypothetical protein B7X48_13750 [Acidiphilium sp. 34-60-192]
MEGRSRRNRNRPSRRVVALPASFNKVRETALTDLELDTVKATPEKCARLIRETFRL